MIFWCAYGNSENKQTEKLDERLTKRTYLILYQSPMTLLNTSMPADKALKIIRSMYESNKTTEIKIVRRNYSAMWFVESEAEWIVIWLDEHRVYFSYWKCEGSIYGDTSQEEKITIVWINQIIPTYSIWDRVLVISTGEIGEVINIVEYADYDNVIVTSSKWDYEYNLSQIAKLPNDL